MVNVALLVRLEAKPGKEQEVAEFIQAALHLAEEETETISWYAIQISPSTFGIFDTFPHEKGRQAHLSGEIAEALIANAAELLASPPIIEQVNVLAAKMPHA
ncbi:putative quinol monooxygenase [Siphonobacter sp.]|uniref:putative quinol monooxygenase n=1 Tax=Siphonobacter sp. TaxID=1869184 RepID=UPI003B3B8CDA